MHITAFDLATSTGVTDGKMGEQPRIFSWHLSDAGGLRPDRFFFLHTMLCKYFETQPCDGVVYEAPLNIRVMMDIGAQDATIAMLRGLIAILEMTCAKYKKPVEEITAVEARKAVLGWGLNSKAKSGIDTKARVMRDVRAQGLVVENDNEADAYVVWQYACARLNPRLAVAQTPLFRSKA